MKLQSHRRTRFSASPTPTQANHIPMCCHAIQARKAESQPHAPRVCWAYIKPITRSCKSKRSCIGKFGHRTERGRWQGQQGSNPRPAVLETAALPTELYPCTVARRLPISSLRAAQEHIRDWHRFLTHFQSDTGAPAEFHTPLEARGSQRSGHRGHDSPFHRGIRILCKAGVPDIAARQSVRRRETSQKR